MKFASFTALAAAATALLFSTPGCTGGAPAKGPVKSVLENYLKIQAKLADDSVQGLKENATAIAKLVNDDTTKALPANVAEQAEALAQAKDLAAARDGFKDLSDSLINYLADKTSGKVVYHVAFCPMVNASWLQTDAEIRNPYLGQVMPTCGEFRN